MFQNGPLDQYGSIKGGPYNLGCAANPLGKGSQFTVIKVDPTAASSCADVEVRNHALAQSKPFTSLRWSQCTPFQASILDRGCSSPTFVPTWQAGVFWAAVSALVFCSVALVAEIAALWPYKADPATPLVLWASPATWGAGRVARPVLTFSMLLLAHTCICIAALGVGSIVVGTVVPPSVWVIVGGFAFPLLFELDTRAVSTALGNVARRARYEKGALP